MSSLIPERPLVISPSLATTIGLEEAVLLQVLNDIATFDNNAINQQYQWHSLACGELMNLLPFWNIDQLQRITQSLQDKGIILVKTPALSDCKTLCFAMNEPHREKNQDTTTTSGHTTGQQPETAGHTDATSHRQEPVEPSRHEDYQQPVPKRGATRISQHWRPNEDLLQLMALNHNIPKDFALAQREDFVLYWLDRGEASHSWSSKFRQHVLKEWRFHQSRLAQESAHASKSNDISQQWRPSPEALEILHRTGVTVDFIEDAIPEFVLYWQERGEASSTWNSKFIAHIRRQWAKFTRTLAVDYEPRPIDANWQPSEDVYDILRLANIDIAFARQLVAEFVLFWRDTKEVQRSWNTKFLQHAKYQWATRHHMEQHYARQPITDQSTQRADQSPFRQLTDRSWAQGLVDGL